MSTSITARSLPLSLQASAVGAKGHPPSRSARPRATTPSARPLVTTTQSRSGDTHAQEHRPTSRASISAPSRLQLTFPEWLTWTSVPSRTRAVRTLSRFEAVRTESSPVRRFQRAVKSGPRALTRASSIALTDVT